VLKILIERDLVRQRAGDNDRRQHLVRLSAGGGALKQRLFADLHNNMGRAYAASGEKAVLGYWMIIQNLMSGEAQRQFAAFQPNSSLKGSG
jgi:DNA-binding MarR family transcriptional regulator